MEHTPLFPREKTLKDLLSEVGDTPCHSSAFIELNKRGMVVIGAMHDFDYEIFWDCMRIYEAQGVNYFCSYLMLRDGSYGDFSQGIEAWFHDTSSTWSKPPHEQFSELVDALRFFQIPSYEGIPFQEYEAHCRRAAELAQSAARSQLEQRLARRDQANRQRMEHYFNFESFSQERFHTLLRGLLLRQEKSISINEALALAQTAPDNTYLVLFKRGDTICHVGKTEHLLSYIAACQKKYQADSAYFDAVDPDYADDLTVSLKLTYDSEVERLRLSAVHRKYGTLQQAISAYRQAKQIPRKRVLAAVERSNVRTEELNNGQVLIDKLALHQALFPGSITPAE